MPNPVIDLRRLKDELKGRITPENELPPAGEELLLETEEAAHPGGFPDEMSTRPLIEWRVDEFEPDASGSVWQLAIGGLLMLGGIGAAVFGNFLFALALLLSGGLMISHAYRAPRRIRFAVTGRGIEIGERRYEFASLESFWIFYDPPLFRELSLRSKHAIMPSVRLPIGGLDPLRLREILLRFLPEHEQEVSLLDVVSKRIGF